MLTRESVAKNLSFEDCSPLKENQNQRNPSGSTMPSHFKNRSPLKGLKVTSRRSGAIVSACSKMQMSPTSKNRSPSRAKFRSSPKHSKQKPPLRSSQRSRQSSGQDRIDLTRMKTNEINDLLAGIDADGKSEAHQKKQDIKQKKKSEMDLLDKIVGIGNIYSIEKGDSAPQLKDGEIPDSTGSTHQSKSPRSKEGHNHTNSIDEDRHRPDPSADVDNAPKENTPVTGKSTGIQKSPVHSWSPVRSNKSPSIPPTSPAVHSKSPVGRSPAHCEDSSIQENDTILDATMPLFDSKMTQTNEVLLPPCSCERCSGVLKDFLELMKKHKVFCMTNDASNSMSPSRSTSSRSNLANKSDNGDEEEKQVLLVKHCPQVKIALSKKIAIPVEVPDGDPQKLLHYLLDCLYTTEQLAGMTCDGKGADSTALDKDVARVLEVYVNSKYDSELFNFNNKLFKYYVNAKCHKARNFIWKYHPELVGKTVRGKLQKNVKKQGNGDQVSKKISKSKISRFKARSPRKQGRQHGGKGGNSKKPAEKDKNNTASKRIRSNGKNETYRKASDSEQDDDKRERERGRNRSREDYNDYDSEKDERKGRQIRREVRTDLESEGEERGAWKIRREDDSDMESRYEDSNCGSDYWEGGGEKSGEDHSIGSEKGDSRRNSASDFNDSWSDLRRYSRGGGYHDNDSNSGEFKEKSRGDPDDRRRQADRIYREIRDERNRNYTDENRQKKEEKRQKKEETKQKKEETKQKKESQERKRKSSDDHENPNESPIKRKNNTERRYMNESTRNDKPVNSERVKPQMKNNTKGTSSRDGEHPTKGFKQPKRSILQIYEKHRYQSTPNNQGHSGNHHSQRSQEEQFSPISD